MKLKCLAIQFLQIKLYANHFLDEETNTLLDLNEKDIEKIKVKKKLPGKKIKSIEVLVRVANNN